MTFEKGRETSINWEDKKVCVRLIQQLDEYTICSDYVARKYTYLDKILIPYKDYYNDFKVAEDYIYGTFGGKLVTTLWGIRPMLEHEIKAHERIEKAKEKKAKAKSEAAKKAALSRAKRKEQKELKLLESLKEKYEGS